MKRTILMVMILLLITNVMGAVTHEFTFDNWSLNDSIGSVTGTKVNAVVDETDCFKGECITFNNYIGMGNSNVQYVSLSAPLVDVTSQNPFTVRCAIKTDSLYPGSMAQFFANHGTWNVGGESGFGLGIGDGKLYFNDYGVRGFLSTETINVGTWYIITSTYSSSDHKMYLNGVPVTLNGAEGDMANYPVQDEIWFGAYSYNFNGEYAWDGSVDECKTWDTVLTPSEVLADYQALTIPPCMPEWECSEYSDVCELRQAKCISVIDINECGETYIGDYSEFDKQDCVRENRDNNAGYISQKSVESQPTQFNLFNAISQLILNIRKALGLE